MVTSYSEEYLGQRLFHFWMHEPPDRAFRTFTSIAERGLLLSRATKELVDSFPYRTDNGQISHTEIVQNARVCLTDIPEDKLKVSRVCEQYGRCAVGFSRKQILAWGGLPVWYLPNHCHPGTMTDAAAAFLYWIAEAVVLIRLLPDLLEKTGSHLTKAGLPMPAAETRQRVLSVEQSIHRLGSFLKEMSGKASDDHQYLYEREWRIVSGCIPPDLEDPCRKLNDTEKAELLALRGEWGGPMQANDPRVTQQLSGEPLIDSFHFFNGLPGQTVSQAIEVILVPDPQFADRVRKYIEEHPGSFREGRPAVKVLA
jgi:hypothetical protein